MDADVLVTAAGGGWGELREGTLKRLLQKMADLVGTMIASRHSCPWPHWNVGPA